MKLTLKNIADQVRDEHDAYLPLEELRWHGKPVCPHCGHDKAYFLNPKGGSRGTGKPELDGKRTQSVRRVWKCAKCRKQFSVLTNTIFHGTKVSLRTWLMVMVQMSSAKNGISAREVERMHGVTPQTAWFMLHRLREAMKRDPLAGLLSGTTVADETSIGGKPKNRHQQGRNRPGTSKGHAGTPKDETPVLHSSTRPTGEVRSRVVANVTGESLGPPIREQVDIAKSHLQTDGGHGYRATGREVESHEYVEHAAPVYEFDARRRSSCRSLAYLTTAR